MLSRDEVLRIAEEAGFGRLLPAFGSIPSCWHGQDIGRLEQFAAAAYAAGQAAEREACLAEIETGIWLDKTTEEVLAEIAAAIRARGEKGGV